MNRFVIAVVVILAVGAGVYFYTSQQTPQPAPTTTPTETGQANPTPPSTPGGQSQSGTQDTSSGSQETPSTPATGEGGKSLTTGEKAPVETAAPSTPTTPSAPAATPATSAPRKGEIPASAKVLDEDYGLVDLGTPGGKLVVAGVSGPKTLNSLVGQETSSSDVFDRLHAGLVELNPKTFDIEPALASDWEFSEDKTSVTFHLRQGLKFSDGQPLTSDDVVFTFNDLVYNLDVNNSTRDTLVVDGQPLMFEALDAYTVKVSMAKPFRPIMRSIGTNIMPKHLLADKVAKLNPGVGGVLQYLKQTLDTHRGDLEAAAVDQVEAVDWALKDLETALVEKDAAKVTATAVAIEPALQALIAALDEGSAEVKKNLERAVVQVQQLGSYAEAGKWAGVSPGAFNQTWGTNTPAEQIAGMGPFKFVRYDVDQQVILERNPYYWKVDKNGVQLPYIDQLVILYVENVETAVLKFRSGELATRGLRPEDWPVFIEGFDPSNDCTTAGIKTICSNANIDYRMLRAGPDFGTLFYALNQDSENLALRAVFRELKYRQAMAHAVDKQSIIDNLYNGLAVEQWSPVSMTSPYYDEASVQRFPFDLEAAQQLLDELGLTDLDGDGVRNIPDAFLTQAGVDLTKLAEDQQNESDRELDYQLETYSGSKTIENQISLIASDLKKIGVNVAVKILDFNALVSNIFSGNYAALMVGFTGGVEPYNGRNLWATDGNLHFWRFSSKDNPPAWEARVDELFNLASTEFDEEKVQAYYAEFQRLASENLPLIFTVNNEFLYVFRSSLRNTGDIQAITGNVSPVFAFSEVFWWDDPQRRALVDTVEPQ